jgi:hypothetical protein
VNEPGEPDTDGPSAREKNKRPSFTVVVKVLMLIKA